MERRIGNLVRELKEGVLVHQVNCQGKMNSGIAKEIRQIYPIVYHEYVKLCACAVMPSDLLGCMQPVEIPGTELVIVNLFSQKDYGYDGGRYTSYDAMDEALEKLHRWMFERTLVSLDVHHPLIGCGLGGAKWEVVEAIIKHRIGDNTTLWTLPEG